MKKLSEKGRKALRMIYRGLGVTAVSLIFQACYGMPYDMGDDVTIYGSVRAKETSKPIKGIRVLLRIQLPKDLQTAKVIFMSMCPGRITIPLNLRILTARKTAACLSRRKLPCMGENRD